MYWLGALTFAYIAGALICGWVCGRSHERSLKKTAGAPAEQPAPERFNWAAESDVEVAMMCIRVGESHWLTDAATDALQEAARRLLGNSEARNAAEGAPPPDAELGPGRP